MTKRELFWRDVERLRKASPDLCTPNIEAWEQFITDELVAARDEIWNLKAQLIAIQMDPQGYADSLAPDVT